MEGSTRILPGLQSVMGKPVHVAFDGGQMTSGAGVLIDAVFPSRSPRYTGILLLASIE